MTTIRRRSSRLLQTSEKTMLKSGYLAAEGGVIPAFFISVEPLTLPSVPVARLGCTTFCARSHRPSPLALYNGANVTQNRGSSCKQKPTRGKRKSVSSSLTARIRDARDLGP